MVEQPRTPTSPPITDTNIEDLLNGLSEDSFRGWWRKKQYRENVENGNPEYNTGGYDTDDLTHNPHKLLQCKRKIRYREENTPQETDPPDGIFWHGSRLEQEIVEPWLQSEAEIHGLYVQNSKWIQTQIERDIGKLEVMGSTDPVVVMDDGAPKIVTEVKSKANADKLSSPIERHKAQLHSYMVALGREYNDGTPVLGALIYIGKKRFDVKVFTVKFDEEFWENRVLEWCEDLSKYRLEDELPPGEHEWESHYSKECGVCEYRGRCGKEDDVDWENVGYSGFLPRFEYPEAAVREHLAAHPDAKITPTIAAHHPDLTEKAGVLPWACERCETVVPYDEYNHWDGNQERRPWCPDCANDNICVELGTPDPDKQPEFW